MFRRLSQPPPGRTSSADRLEILRHKRSPLLGRRLRGWRLQTLIKQQNISRQKALDSMISRCVFHATLPLQSNVAFNKLYLKDFRIFQEFLNKATSVFHIRQKIKSWDYELPLHKLATLKSQTNLQPVLLHSAEGQFHGQNETNILLLCITVYSLVYLLIQFLSIFWVFIMSYIFWWYVFFFF